MVLDVNSGLSVFTDFVNQSTFFGVSYVIPILIVFLSVVLITRDKEQWKTLLFPVAIAWLIAGMSFPKMTVYFLIMMFILVNIGIKRIGNIAAAPFQMYGETAANVRRDRDRKMKIQEKSRQQESRKQKREDTLSSLKQSAKDSIERISRDERLTNKEKVAEYLRIRQETERKSKRFL